MDEDIETVRRVKDKILKILWIAGSCFIMYVCFKACALEVKLQEKADSAMVDVQIRKPDGSITNFQARRKDVDLSGAGPYTTATEADGTKVIVTQNGAMTVRMPPLEVPGP